jgi:hypothetical protein
MKRERERERRAENALLHTRNITGTVHVHSNTRTMTIQLTTGLRSVPRYSSGYSPHSRCMKILTQHRNLIVLSLSLRWNVSLFLLLVWFQPNSILIIIMALQPFVGPWPLFSFLILYLSARTPWTEQHKHRIKAHNTDIHAWSEIRTYDSSDRASEDSSCLRPRRLCDRQLYINDISIAVIRKAAIRHDFQIAQSSSRPHGLFPYYSAIRY